MTLDLICRVVDNYGDIAVVWRLAQALVEDAQGRWNIRLLVDDWDAFHALNPVIDPVAETQVLSLPAGKVLAVRTSALPHLDFYRTQPADVLVEAFGAPTPVVCLEAFFFAAQKAGSLRRRVILHLEYLTAEPWSEEYHLLPSPIGRPGVERVFFVPGFLPRTGGLAFVDKPVPPLPRPAEDWVISVFSYEHNFQNLWSDLADFLSLRGQTARVRVFEGRQKEGALNSLAFVRSMRGPLPNIVVEIVPFVDQDTYTSLAQQSDFNIVRGEESWVVAILSGKPFLWHAYLQSEGHQSVKVEAFLEVLERRFSPEGVEGQRVFSLLAREFRAFNHRLINSHLEEPKEHYRVFWENRDLLQRVLSKWAAELRNSAKLSRRMLEFLDGFRV